MLPGRFNTSVRNRETWRIANSVPIMTHAERIVTLDVLQSQLQREPHSLVVVYQIAQTLEELGELQAAFDAYDDLRERLARPVFMPHPRPASGSARRTALTLDSQAGAVYEPDLQLTTACPKRSLALSETGVLP